MPMSGEFTSNYIELAYASSPLVSHDAKRLELIGSAGMR
jgi:hypothetical protein